MWFRADWHHIYVQEKNYPQEEWVQKKYKIMEEDVHLIMQDLDPEWNIPTNGTKVEHLDNDVEEHSGEHGNVQGDEHGRDAEHMQETVKDKRKDEGRGQPLPLCKKKKDQKETCIYTLTNDDIDKIGYQVRNVVEEVVKKALCKKEELHKEVQEKLTTLQ
jgi:NACalpha-BTF3-like transcription factor